MQDLGINDQQNQETAEVLPVCVKCFYCMCQVKA